MFWVFFVFVFGKKTCLWCGWCSSNCLCSVLYLKSKTIKQNTKVHFLEDWAGWVVLVVFRWCSFPQSLTFSNLGIFFGTMVLPKCRVVTPIRECTWKSNLNAPLHSRAYPLIKRNYFAIVSCFISAGASEACYYSCQSTLSSVASQLFSHLNAEREGRRGVFFTSHQLIPESSYYYCKSLMDSTGIPVKWPGILMWVTSHTFLGRYWIGRLSQY